MPSSEYAGFFLRVTMVVVPVGLYFLLLGLLNSRRHPQVLSGRQDFSLLIVAFSPVLIHPVLSLVGVSLTTVVAAGLVVAGAVVLLAPRRGKWVIYNLPTEQARLAVGACLEAIGLPAREDASGFRSEGGDVVVRMIAFPLLRNVSVRIEGGHEALHRRFEASLAGVLSTQRAETSPATVALLLVAVGMMVAPLTLVAHRGDEIVRILVDLL